MLEKISDANFPIDSQGRTYHVSTARGSTANRVLTVGDPARLHRIANLLDDSPAPYERVSARGFTTVTGRYKGVPVSLIAIGMGVAMTDFFVREVRAVVEGELAIVRFGSCGSLDPTFHVGSLGVPEESVTISTNYDYFHDSRSSDQPPYLVSAPIKADPELHEHLLSMVKGSMADSQTSVRSVSHASADTFYASQGRNDPNFEDANEDLLAHLGRVYPKCASLEVSPAAFLSRVREKVLTVCVIGLWFPNQMETAHLLHLATRAKPLDSTRGPSIRAAAVHMVFAGRASSGEQGDFIDPDRVAVLEPKVGRACLDALVAWKIDDRNLHPEAGSVWEKKA
ncbi:hypothetical protein JCM10212_007050 [Sporobolomyces blumeae]